METVRYKPKPITFPEDDPFRDDLLGRKESTEILTTFVGSLSEPFVLAINSPWGTGKSTFLNMWIKVLKSQGFHCLYFNAWENDFSESPLVSLIGELGSGIAALTTGDKNEDAVQKALQKTKRAGAALLRIAVPTIAKLATAGALDLSAATEADISKLAESIAKGQIDRYHADKTTIAGFKEQLAKLVEALREQKTSIPQKPTLFIIDELDRCRPLFAIELLEKIKHLFAVEGLVFVLAIDRQQLGKSVESLYGSGMDSDGYLRRFIDMEYRLPVADDQKFCDALFSRFDLDAVINKRVGNQRQDVESLREVLPVLFRLFRFSLRTQEQCFTQISVVLRTTAAHFYIYADLLALLICLRVANSRLYARYCSGSADIEEIIDYLNSQEGGPLFLNSDIGSRIEAFLVVGIKSAEKRNKAIVKYQELAEKPKTPPDERSSAAAATYQFLKHLNSIGIRGNDITDYVHKKIEMTKRFH